jgi:uncharacterized ferritin-like protein (DUF455 family)
MTTELHQAAGACLAADTVDAKLAMAAALADDWKSRRLRRGGTGEPPGPPVAGRPARPPLVRPAQLAQRRLSSSEGHAALLHAVAHIEFNAINLACDAVYRFRELPDAFYTDWSRIAAEEAYHFSLLRGRLDQLGFAYGDFPAHNGLWELAEQTAADPLLRMALVPRVMEARGLDVTPGMMDRLRRIGDQRSVEILEIILRDEIGHVEAGSRWFRYLCAQRGLEPESTYFALLETHLPGGVRCPLHKAARRQAGFTENELDRLEELCAKGG